MATFSISVGKYEDDRAVASFAAITTPQLLTRYCKTTIDFPSESFAGYLLVSSDPIQLSPFSYTRRSLSQENYCTLEILPPVQWCNPLFLVTEYYFGGNRIDRVTITSKGAEFIEADALDADTFFDRQVSITKTRPRRQAIVRFPKRYRRRKALDRFLRDYRFHSQQCEGVALLKNNAVELALSFIKSLPH